MQNKSPISLVGAPAVLLVLALAWPASSSAAIIPGRGIAGVKLGDTKKHVRSALGKPRCLSCAHGKLVWGFGAPLQGSVGFDSGGHVYGIATKSTREHTKSGIHPSSSRLNAAGQPSVAGSSELRVMHAYPHARCGLGPQLGSSFQCTVPTRFRGRAVATRFVGIALRGYGVAEIEIEFG
jgi:hypothetical protein